jgi:UDP-glucose 4-epimerase
VREVIDVAAEVIGRDLNPEVVARRPGDPAYLVATADRIRDELGWSATRDLTDMVRSAWSAWQAT